MITKSTLTGSAALPGAAGDGLNVTSVAGAAKDPPLVTAEGSSSAEAVLVATSLTTLGKAPDRANSFASDGLFDGPMLSTPYPAWRTAAKRASSRTRNSSNATEARPVSRSIDKAPTPGSDPRLRRTVPTQPSHVIPFTWNSISCGLFVLVCPLLAYRIGRHH